VIPGILCSEERVDPLTGQTVQVPVEPLSCDWRISRRKARVEELPRLAAALLGCGYDELRQRERQYRTRRRTAIFSAALVSVLAFSAYVIRNNIRIQEANTQLELANTQLTDANISIQNNLKQAQKTENAFMASEWKPSIIVKVDALTEEFASPEGREKLLQSYVKPQRTGEPWLIPAEQFQVEQVRPLTLADLAIKDTVELDKRTVAAVLGVPAFLLGVGEYSQVEWNNFVQTKIRAIALGIQQEMTRTLIVSPKWYLQLNFWSLMDYDLKSTSDILLAGADRGYVCGDEWRDRMHMAPAGLKEYKVLENYIPYEDSGKQKKLVQDGD
jgi:hypothetical protein